MMAMGRHSLTGQEHESLLVLPINFLDHPRDRELLEHLQAARARAGWGSLESRVKYFLEIMLGLSVPICDPLSLRDLGLRQWPPRLVETIRTLPARHDKGKKKQASAILF